MMMFRTIIIVLIIKINETDDEAKIADHEDAQDINITHSNIKFHNINFQYNADEKDVLTNINLKAPNHLPFIHMPQKPTENGTGSNLLFLTPLCL